MLMIIAMCSMLIDHVGFSFFNNCFAMRAVGRIAMPIYAYFIASGYEHTHDRKKYLKKIGILTLASQIPYMLLFHKIELNICAVWFITVLLFVNIDRFKEDRFKRGTIVLCAIYTLLIIPMDYGAYAAIWAVLFYFRNKTDKKTGLIILITGAVISNLLADSMQQWFSMAAIPIIFIFEKLKITRAENKAIRSVYSIFYPAHMLMIDLLQFVF